MWRERGNQGRQMKKKRGILRMQPAGYQVEGDRAECVSGSCERLSDEIWVNAPPSPWDIIVKSTQLGLYICVRFL